MFYHTAPPQLEIDETFARTTSCDQWGVHDPFSWMSDRDNNKLTRYLYWEQALCRRFFAKAFAKTETVLDGGGGGGGGTTEAVVVGEDDDGLATQSRTVRMVTRKRERVDVVITAGANDNDFWHALGERPCPTAKPTIVTATKMEDCCGDLGRLTMLGFRIVTVSVATATVYEDVIEALYWVRATGLAAEGKVAFVDFDDEDDGSDYESIATRIFVDRAADAVITTDPNVFAIGERSGTAAAYNRLQMATSFPDPLPHSLFFVTSLFPEETAKDTDVYKFMAKIRTLYTINPYFYHPKNRKRAHIMEVNEILTVDRIAAFLVGINE
jgi:hypothetical protein